MNFGREFFFNHSLREQRVHHAEPSHRHTDLPVHGPQLRDGPSQPGQRPPVFACADPGHHVAMTAIDWHGLPPLPAVLCSGPADVRARLGAAMEPSFAFMVAGLSSLGTLVDNWLDVIYVVVQGSWLGRALVRPAQPERTFPGQHHARRHALRRAADRRGGPDERPHGSDRPAGCGLLQQGQGARGDLAPTGQCEPGGMAAVTYALSS